MSNSSGVNATVVTLDLVFIPIDYVAFLAQPSDISSEDATDVLTLDATGYLSRSLEPITSGVVQGSAGRADTPVNFIPSQITLQPKVDQRIYLTWQPSRINPQVSPDDTIDAYINIVPRWYGIRDE
jgi:hypothetical protein